MRTAPWCRAEIPEVELTRYAIDLRSLSHGAGSFTRSFARYEPMPESRRSPGQGQCLSFAVDLVAQYRR